MKLKKPKNENYCGTIVRINSTIPLENCDNIQSTIIFGNSIIIGKDTKVGDTGVYFPAETQLSHEYASINNLYRHSNLNTDQEKKGYLEDNRRIRTMRMRGNRSCGLFMPVSSLSTFVELGQLSEMDSFDELTGTAICNKYIVKKRNPNVSGKKGKTPKISKLINGQFRLHQDTTQFGKSIHLFHNSDIVGITYKLHGTSVVISKVLCKKKLNWLFKVLKKLGVPIVDTEYDNIYSSRKVVKNDYLNTKQHFYDVDIWGLANKELKEFLDDGLTIYAEIVGYLPSGAYIQKPYDYGCDDNEHKVYIYRITYTNISGKVFDFSHKQIQDWCKERGLNPVPELYYGYVSGLIYKESDNFSDNLMESIRGEFLEQDCFMCKTKLPAEGIVIRKESNEFDAFKFKSFRFLEKESKQLDEGIEDIEG